MKQVIFLSCVIFSVSAFSQTNSSPKKSAAKAIICLTYDDGLASHLSVAVPQLDSAGLKATFFLNSIAGSSDVIGQASVAVVGWQRAAQKGHELGNHTLFHPCPEKLGWEKQVAIEQYTLKRILEEVTLSNALLSLLDNKKTKRTFAYPCNNVIVEGKDYSAELKKTGLISYARGGGDRTSMVADYKALNPMQVPSWLVEEGTTLNELIAFAEKVKQAGGMGIYQFHGIGGEFFQISKETHKLFLQYLNANKEHYQVATFSEAMNSITTR
ncbi:polysaccharide deacetylase family protein [Cytophagaceae bacterium YF14B1]|nr:polysaccharide deacetylase family protein [Xanthocytophaga flavus]MDJ1482470.1 polysaccharide deacetylase family protein [Xanthocytophaga flavus]